MTKRMRTGMMLGATLLAAQLGFASSHKHEAGMSRVEREVRREIVTLPFYSLFDHFAFRVDGETVTLMGKVSRPTLKSDAENVVKKIEGVEKVNNQIEVLPSSRRDDAIRMSVYRAIYEKRPLEKYGTRAVPPIHIIVKNANVTLEGFVDSDEDVKAAYLRALKVAPHVTNNLRVAPEG